MVLDTDVRILEAEPFFNYEMARSQLKFGGVVMDRALLCHVRVVAENRRGDWAEGHGAILLADLWAWPSEVSHETSENLMKQFVLEWCNEYAGDREFAHPIDHFFRRERELENTAKQVCLAGLVTETMPRLASLVCASPFDAAVHDAFGKAANIDAYCGYGKEYLDHDLERWLGPEFRGAYISDFLTSLRPKIDVFHLVGGFDKLTQSEVTHEDSSDGLPVSLEQWIQHEGIHCLKIKLRGNDIDWDLHRLCSVVEVARSTLGRSRAHELQLTADTNEMCESPEYMIELLLKFKERDPRGFDSLLYIEQPCERDLRQRMLDVRQLNSITPVFVDESLASLEDLDLAIQLGYSGAALKTCKCQSEQLLIAAKAAKLGIQCSVQDLANTGIALIQSVGFAGRLPAVHSVESNSRQYYPGASTPERRIHPGIFHLIDGQMQTSSISGPGLGYRWDEIGRQLVPHPASEKKVGLTPAKSAGQKAMH